MRFKLISKEEALGLSLGILAAVLVILMGAAGFLEKAELMTLDWRVLPYGRQIVHPDLVLVGITHQDLEELGKFPWPRSYYGEVVNYLSRCEASTILFDIFFPQPSDSPGEDIEFSKAIRDAGNVILPIFSPTALIPAKDNLHIIPEEKIVENISLLGNAAYTQGHINLIADRDGVYRRLPIALQYGKKVFFAAEIEAVAKHLGIKQNDIRWEDKFLLLGQKRLPLHEGKFFYINFADVEETIPFRYVLRKEIPQEFFKGKIVLIGQTAQGLPNADILMTPYKEMYGVMIQASIINTLLGDSFVRRFSPKANLLMVLLFSIFLGGALSGQRPLRGTLYVIFCLLVVLAVSIALFLMTRIVLEVMPLASAVFLNYIFALLMRIRIKEKVILKKDLQFERLVEAGKLTTAKLDPSKTVDVIIGTMVNAVDGRGAILRLYDEKSGKTKDKVTFGLAAGLSNRPEAKIDEEIANEAAKTGKALLLENVRLNVRFKGIRRPIVSSLMVVPLFVRERLIGTLTVYNKATAGFLVKRTQFGEEELRLLTILSHQAAIALENARLYENVQQLFMGSIKALAETIDAKDPYTLGHSERVTKYSIIIAEEIGLSSGEIERLRIAAILHDIGKIGIKDAVLSKPTKLTPEEKAEFDKHSHIGAHIMEPIEQLEDIVPIIEGHHERFDGGGYPRGLAGKSIPKAARIIAVADTFDAMTSDRPYRKALSEEEAAKEISRFAGIQFDPEVVSVFYSAYQKGKIKRTG